MTLYGYHLNMGTNIWREVQNESAIQFASRVQELHKETEASLKLAAEQMKDAYDKKQQEASQYKPSDLVLLNMKNIRTTCQMKKLDNLRDGPLEIMRKIGKALYQLKLPLAWTKAGIHPVFNETMLHPYHRPAFDSQRSDPPPPPDIINDHEEYEVERILDARMWRGRIQYHVK